MGTAKTVPVAFCASTMSTSTVHIQASDSQVEDVILPALVRFALRRLAARGSTAQELVDSDAEHPGDGQQAGQSGALPAGLNLPQERSVDPGPQRERLG
jgi:hypothetical protein